MKQSEYPKKQGTESRAAGESAELAFGEVRLSVGAGKKAVSALVFRVKEL